MKKKLIIYGILFFVLQLIKIGLIEDYKKDYGKGRIEMVSTNSELVEYRKVKRSEGYETYIPILFNQSKQYLEDNHEEVRVIGTTYNYKQLEHLSMVSGAFFGKKAVEQSRNVVVISDNLALELFHSTKAEGNTLSMNGERYQVVGVYKKYSRLRDYISADYYEQIYVPITSKIACEKGIQQIIIDKDIPNNHIKDYITFEDLGIKEDLVIKQDYSYWIKQVRGVEYMPILVLHLWILIKGVKILYARGKRSIYNLYIGNNSIYQLSLDYNEQIYRRNNKEIIMWGIMSMGYFIYLVIVIKISISKIYIETGALPKENIFDVMFYWEKLCKQWTINHMFIVDGVSKFTYQLGLLKRSLHIMNIIQYVLIIKLMCYRKNTDCHDTLAYRKVREENETNY